MPKITTTTTADITSADKTKTKQIFLAALQIICHILYLIDVVPQDSKN